MSVRTLRFVDAPSSEVYAINLSVNSLSTKKNKANNSNMNDCQQMTWNDSTDAQQWACSSSRCPHFWLCSLLNFLSIVKKKPKILSNLKNFLFPCFAFRCSPRVLTFLETIQSVHSVVVVIWAVFRGFIMYVHGAVNKVLNFEDICKLNHPIR